MTGTAAGAVVRLPVATPSETVAAGKRLYFLSTTCGGAW